MRRPSLVFSSAVPRLLRRGPRVRSGTPDAVAAPVPLHPSYEDHVGAPDVVFAAVLPDSLSIWRRSGRGRSVGLGRPPDIFHLHHLTSQHDAVRSRWPGGGVVAHLHGTDMKFLEAVGSVPRSPGRWGRRWPAWPNGSPPTRRGTRSSTIPTRAAADNSLGAVAARRVLARPASPSGGCRGPHVAVSPTERAMAVEVLRADPDRVTDSPNGVDVNRFRPRPMSHGGTASALPALARRGPAGLGSDRGSRLGDYRESDLDRLLGPGRRRHRADLRRTLHRLQARPVADTRLRPCHCPASIVRASLLLWGGHPANRKPTIRSPWLGTSGRMAVFFAGWRGHDDLPEGSPPATHS